MESEEISRMKKERYEDLENADEENMDFVCGC